MTTPPVPQMYDVEDVAPLLGMSKKTLWRMCRERKIPHHRFGHFIRFSETDLQAMLQETRVEVEEDELVPVGRRR